MKKLSIITGIASLALFLASCSPETTMQKDIKYMPVRFKPLARTDFNLVGNLQAEVTLTGKGNDVKKTLDKSFQSNLKEGKLEQWFSETLYFAPGPGEAITGSLYDDDIFNTVTTSASIAPSKKSIFQILFPAAYAKKKAPSKDWGASFAYYNLIAKYPDVDYFVNVRFERKTVYKGKSYSETVIVKADGVKLKTD